MTQYKGYYIDHVYFNSKADIDEFLKQKAIREYKIRCQIFASHHTMEASIYADEQAERLNKEYGISWDEIEKIEIEAYKTA